MPQNLHGKPLFIVFLTIAAHGVYGQQARGWSIAPHEDKKQIDILFDGQWLTSYCWYDSIRKPILFPIKTLSGITVTRGFPIDPRPGERVDHPHHTGLWFNYESVNGLDFWNNSTAIPLTERHRYGTIRHRKVIASEANSHKASLTIEAAWMTPDGTTLLKEETQFVFTRRTDQFIIDRITRLTAPDQDVLFKDTKDGLLGIRVARELEMPSKGPLEFVDINGNVTKVDSSSSNTTGNYKSSEGLTGDAVWGTRGMWCSLSGTIDGHPVTITIIDHSGNPGYPTYWHARGYGLFAANPLGQEIFSKGKESLNLKIESGRSATFRYRIAVTSGTDPRPEQLRHLFLDEY